MTFANCPDSVFHQILVTLSNSQRVIERFSAKMPTKMQRVGDGTDDGGNDIFREQVAAQILNSPVLMAALHEQIDNSGATTLAAPIKRRVNALKCLQLEATNIEARFFEEVHRLECKYHREYVPLYEKRNAIVTGVYEPSDKECEWLSDVDDLGGDMANKLKIEDLAARAEDAQEKPADGLRGVPGFWLTIFKNVGLLSDLMQPHDEPILKHLTDIKVLLLDADPMGFVLQFHFAPNEFFGNAVLVKQYDMKCAPEPDDPFSFEGTEIFRCQGCQIDWRQGKNVTVKTVKKRQKHKALDQMRTVLKTVKNESFFNFFAPPAEAEEDAAELDERTRANLTHDFEVGHYLKDRIVPRAVLYYTGEALDDEKYDEEDEDAEDRSSSSSESQ